jgi:hypothetical protein
MRRRDGARLRDSSAVLMDEARAQATGGMTTPVRHAATGRPRLRRSRSGGRSGRPRLERWRRTGKWSISPRLTRPDRSNVQTGSNLLLAEPRLTLSVQICAFATGGPQGLGSASTNQQHSYDRPARDAAASGQIGSWGNAGLVPSQREPRSRLQIDVRA